ncbi:MAG TPA: hypothetical protein EYN07_06115 [Flavobacteriaceae bacterium]|nr:hypothetical protein [Flavobacteriaceae bacterium]HIN98799.1 hypothetical protein [Flavobacteriaceae bacterium]
MKTLFSVLKLSLILLFCGNVIAQVDNQFASDLYMVDEFIKRQDKFVDYMDTASYTGTPYNNESFLLGNVYNGKELLANDVALRYNAVADEIEIKESLTSPDEDARLLTKSPEIYVKIMGDIYIFAPYKGGVEGGGYFQVLYEGNKIDLYKKLEKDFTPEKISNNSITRDVKASFSDEITYYLADKDGKFYELPKSRNKKLKVFGKKKDEIKAYVRENGLDLNTEKDLLRTTKHYDISL